MTNQNPLNPEGIPEIIPRTEDISENIQKKTPIEDINGALDHVDEDGEWIDFNPEVKKPQLPN